ncbi:MAG: DegT/DnrJ/EryC1/StrS family aminotransferase, partial [candidate division WOR-3 bacterium]
KIVGGNFRLDALQAAIVLAKLKHLDDWTGGRQSNARRYDALFEASGLLKDGLVQLPHVADYSSASTSVSNFRHIFNQYVIRVPRRDELKDFLKDKSIGTEVYYPLPLHLQKCFAYLGLKPGDCPESEKAAQETLALPVYPELSNEQAQYVVDCIRTFFAGEM